MRAPSLPGLVPAALRRDADRRLAADTVAHGTPIAWHPVWHGALADAEPGGTVHARQLHAQALRGVARRTQEPLALSVKLPFCAAHCLCCDRPIHAAQPADRIEAYVAQAIQELRLLADAVGSGRELMQVHLGGGTVNELSDSQIVRLAMAMQGPWRLPAEADKSVECDPRRISMGVLELLRGLGFDHVTFGVLDLDADVQRAIGRQHSAALVDDVCEQARASGIESINLDVMIGLPGQTAAGWRRTLQALVAMGPDRITLTRYRHCPWHAPGQQAIDPHLLPRPFEVHELAVLTSHLLRDAGYRWIGADKYVLESDDLSQALDDGRLRRSLVGYTAAPAGPLLGVGTGALTEIDGSLFWNDDTLPGWNAALQGGELPVVRARLAEGTDARRRAVAERLLCTQELAAEQLQGGLEAVWPRLAAHASQGWVTVVGDRLVVTEAGRHELLALCAEVATAPWPADVTASSAPS